MKGAATCWNIMVHIKGGVIAVIVIGYLLLFSWSIGYCTPDDASTIDLEVSKIGMLAATQQASLPTLAGSTANPIVPKRDIALPNNVTMPIKVGVSLIVNKLQQINEQAGTFTAEVDLHYHWRDPRQAFDKAAVGMDRQEYNNEEALKKLAAIWTPGLRISNMAAKPHREEHGLWIFSDGTVHHIYRLTAVFETRYNLKAFPFDAQALSINLSAPLYSIAKVELINNQTDLKQSGIRQNCVYQGWELVDVSFKSNQTRAWNGSLGSELTAQVNVERDFAGHIFVVFLPMFVLITLPLLYLQDSSISYRQRLGALSGNMLAFITLYFTSGLRYPVLDINSSVLQLFRVGFAYFFALLFLVAAIYNPSFAERVFNKDWLIEIKDVLRWGIPFLIYSLMLYTLLSGFNN